MTTTLNEREHYHNSTAPLAVPKHLQYGHGWCIGVFVEPLGVTATHGRGADLTRNSIEIWHKGGGRWVREAELDHAITDALARTVEDLDTAIAELTAHRERLAAELARRPAPKVEPVQEGLPL